MSLRVLLLEPDVILARAYARALRKRGAAVESVRTAQAAIAAADTKTPDVIVVELQIPMHNGVEFLYECKSYAEWLNIPVVIHTVLAAEELAVVREVSEQLGVRAVLHKAHTSIDEFCNVVLDARTSRPL